MSELSAQGFLDACEREQLHRAQAIQPCGALLGGVCGDPRIRLASGNLEQWLGQAATAVLNQPISTLLPDFPPPSRHREATPAALSWTLPAAEKRLYPNLTQGPAGSLDGLLSAHGDTWLLELETALPAEQRHEAYRPVPHHLYRMPYTDYDWIRHCQYLADELREVSGFERVMIYGFREDACGEVISESLQEGLPPYLGLRYPASDIPQIARDLYLANPHRQIPDIAAPPVPIIGAADLIADLTLSDLRAVSPVHLEYLRNMGVVASLSFSLVVNSRLWGLIACHHSRPRTLPLPLRDRCAAMAQAFTLAISGYQSSRHLLEVSDSDQDISVLLEALRRVDDIQRRDNLTGEELITAESALRDALLSLVGASGAALVTATTLVTFGTTPAPEAIRGLIQWLEQTTNEGVFATDALPQQYPAAAEFADGTAGLLAVRVASYDDSGGRAFLWWRPEQPQTVYWAGDPRKSALFDAQSNSLSPRSSFERWIETTSGHSEPWTMAELLRAKKFRGLILRELSANLLRRI